MKQILAVMTYALVIGLSGRPARAFEPPDPITVAKEIKALDEATKTMTPDTLDSLFAHCFGNGRNFAVRQHACRLIGKRTKLETWNSRRSRLNTTDPILPIVAIAEIRIKARDENLSKADTVARMVSYLEGLDKDNPSKRPHAFQARFRRKLATEELAYYAEEIGIEESDLPKRHRGHSEMASLRLKSTIVDKKKRGALVEWLFSELRSSDSYRRNAAAKELTARKGMAKEAHSRILTLAGTINPPPFGENERFASSAVQIIAASGDSQAERFLEELARNDSKYVSHLAKEYLAWVRAKIEFPIGVRLEDPFVDH